jgi:hypothetical protein
LFNSSKAIEMTDTTNPSADDTSVEPTVIAEPTVAESDENQEEGKLFPASAGNPNVHLERPETRDMTAMERELMQVILALPQERLAVVREGLTLMNRDAFNSPEEARLLQNFLTSTRLLHGGDLHDEWVNSETRDIHQTAVVDGKEIGISRMKTSSNGDQPIGGEAAMIRISEIAGFGVPFSIPLYNSGFWISFKAPMDSTFINLGFAMTQSRSRLGRLTNGAAMNNYSVLFSDDVLAIAVQHIYSCSLKERNELLETIMLPDLQNIALGLAAAMHPKGIPYSRSVIDQTGTKIREITGIIDPTKLQKVDRAALTEAQMRQMTKRANASVDLASVREYQKTLNESFETEVSISEDVFVTLRVPSVAQFLQSGNRWIDGINADADKAFGVQLDEEARAKLIMDLAKANYMRQYAHWVKSVRVNNGDQDIIVDTQEQVEGLLDRFSGSAEISESFEKHVLAFMSKCTVSMVAVPATSYEDYRGTDRFPSLIPIDTMSMFFTLALHKNITIKNR